MAETIRNRWGEKTKSRLCSTYLCAVVLWMDRFCWNLKRSSKSKICVDVTQNLYGHLVFAFFYYIFLVTFGIFLFYYICAENDGSLPARGNMCTWPWRHTNANAFYGHTDNFIIINKVEYSIWLDKKLCTNSYLCIYKYMRDIAILSIYILCIQSVAFENNRPICLALLFSIIGISIFGVSVALENREIVHTQ